MFKKNPLLIIFLTVFIDMLGFSIVIPILAPLLALPGYSSILPDVDLQTRLIVFGFLIGSYALAQFIATPIIGQLSDRYGRKPLLAFSIAGTLISRIIFILGIVYGNIYVLFISRIIDGISGGNISVAQSSIADISTKENKAKNFGLLGAAFGFGFIFGPIISGKLSEGWVISWALNYFPSWVAGASTFPLWFATVLCAINLVLLFAVFPETLKNKVSSKLNLSIAVTNTVNAFKMKSLRVAFLTVFLFTLGFTFFTQFLGVYIQNNFSEEIKVEAVQQVNSGSLVAPIPDSIKNIQPVAVREKAIESFKQKYAETAGVSIISQQKSSDIFTYIGICIVIAQLLLIRLVNGKFAQYKIYRFGLLLNSIAALALLLPKTIWGLYFILPFFAISNGLIQPNSSAIISNSADEKSQGEILGANQSLTALGQAIPPMIAGFISTISPSLTVIVASGTVFIAFLIFAIFYKPVGEKFHEE